MLESLEQCGSDEGKFAHVPEVLAAAVLRPVLQPIRVVPGRDRPQRPELRPAEVHPSRLNLPDESVHPISRHHCGERVLGVGPDLPLDLGRSHLGGRPVGRKMREFASVAHEELRRRERELTLSPYITTDPAADGTRKLLAVGRVEMREELWNPGGRGVTRGGEAVDPHYIFTFNSFFLHNGRGSTARVEGPLSFQCFHL